MKPIVISSIETPEGTLKLQTSSLFRDVLMLVHEPKSGGQPKVIMGLERKTSEWLANTLPTAHKAVFEQN